MQDPWVSVGLQRQSSGPFYQPVEAKGRSQVEASAGCRLSPQRLVAGGATIGLGEPLRPADAGAELEASVITDGHHRLASSGHLFRTRVLAVPPPASRLSSSGRLRLFEAARAGKGI